MREQGQPVSLKSLCLVKNLLLIVFAVDLLAVLIVMASLAETLDFINSLGAVADSSEVARATALDGRAVILNYIYMTLAAITGVLWLSWLAFANRLLNRLDVQGREYGSLWSLGWYVVPIMKLWKPYFAMIEVAQVSADPANWKEQPIPSLVSAWWLLFALCGAAFMVADYYSENHPAIAWQLIALAVVIVLIVVWTQMVSQIHALQVKAAVAIGNRETETIATSVS